MKTGTIRSLYENTYSIVETGKAGAVFMYLLVGEEKAMLIDSGYGGLDLPSIIRTVTDKDVVNVITHGHLDHANGSYHFPEAYLHSLDLALFRLHSSAEVIRPMFLTGVYGGKPDRRAKDPDYQKMVERIIASQKPELKPIDGKMSFDLGNRPVTIVHVPGHTQGHIAIFDEKYHRLFSGDHFGSMTWLHLPESTSVTVFRDHLVEFKKLYDSKNVVRIYPGHQGKGRNPNAVDRYIDLCNLILQGKKKGFTVDRGVMKGRIAFRRQTVLLYKTI